MRTRIVVAAAVVLIAFAALTRSDPARRLATARALDRPPPAMFAFSARSRDLGTVQVFLAAADGTVRRLTAGRHSVQVLSWADPGRIIAREYSEGLGGDTLTAVDPRTGATSVLWHEKGLVWSAVSAAGGGRIAFGVGLELDATTGSGGVRVHRITARYAVRSDPSPAAGPPVSWASEGFRMAFSRPLAGGAVIAVNRPGNRLTRLPTGCRSTQGGCPRDVEPAWRPDRDSIVYVHQEGGRTALRSVTADGRVRTFFRPHGRSAAHIRSPVWSPDGRRLAFVSDSGLDVVDLGDGRLEHVTDGVPAAPPSWSPDGSRIAYVAGPTSSSPQLIVVAPLAGGRPFQLPVLPSRIYGQIVSGVVWNPDAVAG